MNNTIAEFGYNTYKDNFGFTAWECMGTKYNFNIEGQVLGIFSGNGQNFLLSQVTKSYGDDCMVGTIDTREVIIESQDNSPYILLSNNEPTTECMTISRLLSGNQTKQELNAGMSIEQTKAFQSLARLGIELESQNIQLGEKVIVCGIENEHFKKFQNMDTRKTR